MTVTRDEARKVIIAACFHDASGETNYIENAIEKIEAAARIEGLREAFAIFTTSGHHDAIETVRNRIAALEKPK